jgi:murein DD-endopeptidase MepM/ murein hydrolase activator NlpD
MKLIVFNEKSGSHRVLPLRGLPIAVMLLILSFFVGGLGLVIDHVVNSDARAAQQLLSRLDSSLGAQHRAIQTFDRELSLNLEVSAARIARLESRLLRLDALGQRLSEYAALDDAEFDFTQPTGLGGPSAVGLEAAAGFEQVIEPTEADLKNRLAFMSADIERRSDQLAVIERVLLRQQRVDDASLFGKPVAKGWVSSNYGMRTDPFSGKRAWHNGVDIAGKAGVDVVAIASGIVTFAGTKNGYGKMVEINHGGGVITRYGHHESLAVSAGDLVKKGQKIGGMGSSGRSTGPHVHYEIHKNKRSIDPSIYIHRLPRSRSG